MWAGTSSYGFDCLGLTLRVFQSVGISMAQEGLPITEDDLLPGDLVFFATNNGQGQVHHVGIYSGDGRRIHSPSTGYSVTEEVIQGTNQSEYWGAKRYVPNMLSK